MHYKWQLYYVLFLKYQAPQTDFFVIFGYFLHFYPSNNVEDQNFDKMKKTPRDIVILNMSTINEVPKIKIMMNDSQDIEHDRQNFFSFWTIFCPLLFNFWKNEKKNTWRYHHFTEVYYKWQSYDIWFLRYEVQQTYFLSFWAIFCPFTPIKAKKIKIWKNNEKNTWR